MSVESPTHRVVTYVDYFAVYRNREQQVSVTTMSNGKVTTEVKPISQVIPGMEHYSVFTAWPETDGSFTVDVDCGAQRWRGPQSRRAVQAALRKCDFDKKQIKQLMDLYRVS